MNKKGILFTITTFLLLWSLLVLNASYVDRINELKKLVVTTTSGDKLIFLEDDILGEIYTDLLDVDFSLVDSNSENISLGISGFSLSQEVNHEDLIKDYENYVEGDYADLNNIEVELINFSSSFLVEPFGNTMTLNKTIFKSITSQPDNLISISVVIVVDREVGTVISNSTPTDNGDKLISVQIFDEDETIIIDKSASLDESNTNMPFLVRFSNNSNISVRYGDFFGSDGSFSITAGNLIANITSMEITYESPDENMKVSSGFINLIPSGKIMRKYSKVILFIE